MAMRLSGLARRGVYSQGEFWEAAEHRLQPQAASHLLCGRQRLRHQHAGRVSMPGGNISRLVANFPTSTLPK